MKIYRCALTNPNACDKCLTSMAAFDEVTEEFDTSDEAIHKILGLLGHPEPGVCHLIVTEPEFVGKIPERKELPITPKE